MFTESSSFENHVTGESTPGAESFEPDLVSMEWVLKTASALRVPS